MAQRSLLLLGVACLSLCPALAGAASPTTAPANYLAIQLNHVEPDSDRRAEGSGMGATFLYGRRLTGNWGLEARLTGLVLESGPDIRTDFYQQDLGVDAVYHFADFGGWRPFAVAGLSVIRNDVDLAEFDETNLGLNVGGGITGPLSEALGMRWRFDLRYVHDEHRTGRQDIRLGAGIKISLGERGSQSRSPRRSQLDSDNDGIVDADDRCPFSLRGANVDEYGCMYAGQKIRLPDVDFRPGTAILTPAAREELGKVVLALRGQPDLRVRIVGHTDSVGGAAMNQSLSVERAEAVATYLVLQGVSTQRLRTDGRGQSEPIADNRTEDGRARNRRIELHFLEPEDR